MKIVINENFPCLIEEFGLYSQNTNLKHGCGFSYDPVYSELPEIMGQLPRCNSHTHRTQ